METTITFQAGNILLEGLLHRVPGARGVVITHPHSLYGGDMYSPVVEAIGQVYGKKGFSTLRFNFRGVGNSGGKFGDGNEEQEDVLAAVRFLTESGISSIDLAGYSFGCRVLAGIEKVPEAVASQVHVAPPVAFMDYTGIVNIQALHTVICGENDEIAPPSAIRGLISGWNRAAKCVVIRGADHFFGNSMDALRKALEEAVD